jgi:hypothetical protein
MRISGWSLAHAYVGEGVPPDPTENRGAGLHRLSCSNPPRARTFYEDVLGATVAATDATSIDFVYGGVRLRTYLYTGEYRRQHSGLQFLVNDLEAIVDRLRAAAVDLRGGIVQEPWRGDVSVSRKILLFRP